MSIHTNSKKYSSNEVMLKSISNGSFHPVFQAIIDRNNKILGFEVLSRWKSNGRVIMPYEFLPFFTSDALVNLTKKVLDIAVECVNYYHGAFFVSVNIPKQLIKSSTLVPMVEDSAKNLIKQELRSCLALEFSEETNFSVFGDASSVISELKILGYRVMLDDCFSERSVTFPVRSCHFDDYKVDMNLVWDLSTDNHAVNLLKTLVYYCDITGGLCIAEGVENNEQYQLLKTLGVNGFQGFYICQPIDYDDLHDWISAWTL